MRLPVLMLVLALAACGQEAPSAPDPVADAPMPPAPWFICDGLDAPAIIVLTKSVGADGAVAVHVAEYDKANADAPVREADYIAAPPEGAAGSIITPLLADGPEAGAVRQINSGMLENPSAAYTPPFIAVRLGDRDVSCRWMARTRLMGFTERHSFVVNEDEDGDLILTLYEFNDTRLRPIELSNAQRTTTFTRELRGGRELLDANGLRLSFVGPSEALFVIEAPRAGPWRFDLTSGAGIVSSDPIIAAHFGEGPGE